VGNNEERESGMKTTIKDKKYYNKKCSELLGYSLYHFYFSKGEGAIKTDDVIYKFDSDWNELIPASQKVYDIIEKIMIAEPNIFIRNELGTTVNPTLREWHSNLKTGTPKLGFEILCRLIDFIDDKNNEAI
jgi:hypothetical protein